MTTTLPRGAQQRSSRSVVARRRATLLRRGRRLVATADELLGVGTATDDEVDLDAVAVQLDVASASVVEGLSAGRPDAAALGMLLVELQAFRSEVREHEQGERRARLDGIEAGLAPLRWIHDPQELLTRVCEALVVSCGFDRAMLSRVEGSTWRPWKSFGVSARDSEAFRAWITATPEIPLDHLLLESEMVRRHAPAIVASPDDPRVFPPFAQASRLTSYVAAPLMPTGRVIGFLHADYVEGSVSEVDRDVLWAFAEAFGQLFERAVLLTRLREQREQVGRAMETVASVLGELATAEIELAGRRPGPAPGAGGTGLRAPEHVPGSRIEALLTARELEVLTLMATGATNARIAERLVISDATVKSHVKRILRKLRAGNRAEAIARYLRLTMGGDEAD